MNKQEIIFMPAEAIELWKNTHPGMNNDDFSRVILRSIIKGLVFGIAVVSAFGLYLLTNNGMQWPAEHPTLSAMFLISFLGIWLGDTAITGVLCWHTDQRGRVYATRSTILHGMGYNNADPDDYGVLGWNDTFEHRYVIAAEAHPSPNNSS